jgi:phosphoribosylaminoimidazole-succinocarboxamide synthase
MTEEYVVSVSDRYIELYEQITGQPFVKADTSNVISRVQKNIESFLAAYYR